MQLALKITASGGQAKAEILGLSQTVGDLGETSLRSTQQMAAGVTAARRGITSISTQLAQARTLWLSFQALPFASGGLSGIVAVADTWTNLDGRIRLATGSMAASRVAMRDLYAVAQETRTPIAANADLFSRLALSTRQLGVSQAELIEITKTLSQASVVSGASSSSASAAMTQLAQGFASGTLRGDELNSVLEQTPRIAQAIADGLGVPLGALRALGEQGQITAATVIEALRSQAATVQAEFDQMPVTIEQASTRIANAFGRWLNAQNKISGATTDLATALDGVANHMAALASGGIALAEAALAIWLARQTSAVAIAAQAALAARAQKAALLEQTQAELASAEAALAKARADSIMGAVAQQTVADLTAQTAALRSQVADLTGATKAAGIGIAGLFNLLGAGMAGYAIGSWAREEFAVVRQAGDALVLALLKGWEWIKFGAAATWEGIKTGSGEAVGWIGSLFVGLLQVLRNGWQTAQTAATVVWTGAKFAASAAFEGIQTALKGLLTALKTGAESLGLDTVARKIGEWESAIQPAGRALADYRVAMRRVADEATAGYGAIQEGSDRLRAGLDRAKGGVTSLSDSLSKLAQERDRALGGIDAVGVEMFAAPNDVGAPTAPSPRSIPAPRIDPTQAQQAVEQARQLTADLLGTAQDASTKMASEYSARWEALVAVEGAGSARVVALEQAYGQWLAQQERDKTDALLAAARDRSTALEQEWQGQFLTEAERENLRYQRQLEALAAERKAVEDSGQMTAALRARYDRDELRAKQIHENAKAGVEKQAAEARLSLTAGVFGALSALLANGGKKAFEASKALAIAETVVSTYAAAQKAYESQLAIPTPDAPARAAVAAGIAVVQGVARVAAISKQQYGGAASASASAGGGVGAGVQSTPGSMATGSGYGGVTGAHDKAATPPTQPPVTIHLQVQALHPDEVSAGTLQRIAEALSPVLDRNINRGANVAVSV